MLLGFLAYLIWGVFPLYWPLLQPAGAAEILAHRVVWSLVTLVGVATVLRRWEGIRRVLVDRRTCSILAGAAALISVNWGVYIWSVNSGHTVESALGYFINPLVTMTMGVLILREGLRPLQWLALGIALCAVLVIALDYGRLPWIALTLAFSFGGYGFLKKWANAPALEALSVETGMIAPIALGYVVWLTMAGGSHFTAAGAGHTALFVLSGAVTALPLVCFGAAAIRIPMIRLGLLQYLSPILQFIVGVAVQHEQMTAARWAGFVIVWLALLVFTAEALLHAWRGRVPEVRQEEQPA